MQFLRKKQSNLKRIAVGQASRPQHTIVNHDGYSQAQWDAGQSMNVFGWGWLSDSQLQGIELEYPRKKLEIKSMVAMLEDSDKKSWQALYVLMMIVWGVECTVFLTNCVHHMYTH